MESTHQITQEAAANLFDKAQAALIYLEEFHPDECRRIHDSEADDCFGCEVIRNLRAAIKQAKPRRRPLLAHWPADFQSAH